MKNTKKAVFETETEAKNEKDCKVKKFFGNKRNIAIFAVAMAVLVVLATFLVVFLIHKNSRVNMANSVNSEQILDNASDINDESVAFRVDETEFSEDIWNYYFMSFAKNYADSLGMSLEDINWDEENANGETPLDEVKYEALKAVMANISAVSFAKELGIALTEKEKSLIDVDLDYWKQVYGEDVYKELDMKDEATYREIYENYLIQRKVIDTVSEDVAKYLPDVNLADYVNDKSATVKIMGVVKYENEASTLSAKTKIDEMKARLDSGEKFDDIWLESYKETTGMTAEKPTVEIIYKDGTTDKNVETATFALKVGEISDIVETEQSYLIVMRTVGYAEVENYFLNESKIGINKDMINSSKVK